MKFVKKKNLLPGEDLLSVAKLHWMFILTPMVKLLSIIPLLYFIRTMLSFLIPVEMMILFGLNIGYMVLAIIIFALPMAGWQVFLYLSTEYGLTNKRLLIRKGIIQIITIEIPLDRIESINCIQGILGRIFNYGTICISGVGGRVPVFYMICKPYALRRKIVEAIEKNKTIKVIHGDMPIPSSEEMQEPVMKNIVEKEPFYGYGTIVRVIDKPTEKE
jgi:membrane protein YdbS with pleckstrin-like domain